MEETQVPGPEEERRIVSLYYGDDACRIDPEDKALVDRAMQLWTSSGGTRDTWLSLRMSTGAEFQVLASVIVGMTDNTRANRRIGFLLDRRDMLERRLLRAEAGYVPGEDEDE